MSLDLKLSPNLKSIVLACCYCVAFPWAAPAQITPGTLPTASPGQKPGTQQPASTSPEAGKQGSQGGESKSASGSATGDRDYASGKDVKLSPLAPAPPPARVFPNRLRIGLAMGGGGALALTEIGLLQWMDEHRIPVDVIAGTSMGCMVSALYSTGRTPEQLTHVMNDKVFASVFSFSQTYTSKSFRRREDSRDLPNAITIGLRHGISFRNAVLQDQGLNAFLDRQFLRYDDQTDFNTLPIPLRCVSTDLNEARAVTFSRGSIPDAIRASVSLPGIFQPFEMNGHEYVDGGVLDNLPTAQVKDEGADVILAFSLPLAPVDQGSLGSILGVLQRSFSVAIEAAERNQRKAATVVVMPDITGFTANDYLKAGDLAKRGYAAAEAKKAELLQYSVSPEEWQAYQDHLASLRRGPAGPVLRVRVDAPDPSATKAVQKMFAPLVNQPVDTTRIEALLDQVRADGRYDADYTVGYESAAKFRAQQTGAVPVRPGAVDVPVNTGGAAGTTVAQASPTPEQTTRKPENRAPGAAMPEPAAQSTPNQPGVSHQGLSAGDNPGVAASPTATDQDRTREATATSLADIADRPTVLVTVMGKKTGPPFLDLGANIAAQPGAITRATLEGILLDQDLFGYGNELRTHFAVGYLTQIDSEFYHPFNAVSNPRHTFFVAPRAGLLRQPFPIYDESTQTRVATRQLQTYGVGGDVGMGNGRTQELRAGFDFQQNDWTLQIGQTATPDYHATSQRARIRYAFDTQDRALVPEFGVHLVSEAAYLYNTAGSPDAPQLTTYMTYAHRFHLPGHDTVEDPDTHQRIENKGKQIFLLGVDAGTMANHNVAQPYRFTLGGPFRLSASGIDEYRGTDYFLIAPALLRRIAELPRPLGQSIYVGAAYEAGRMYAPNTATITRQDVLCGLVAETPLGVITAAPSFGTDGHRKFTFTLGRFF